MQHSNAHKQAFWFTIINYLGTAIGIVATIFIYPYDKDFLGKIGYIDSIAQMLFPVMVFGGGQALIHFYPSLTDTSKAKLFAYSIRTLLVIGLILAMILFTGQYITDWEKYTYLFYAFPLAVVMGGIELFKRQAANLQKIAVPTVYEKIIPKIVLPCLFVLLLGGYINEQLGLTIFVIAFFLLLLLTAVYVLKQFSVPFTTNFKPLFKEIEKKSYYHYAFYAFLGSLGSFLAFRLDGVMIPMFLEFDDNGSYKIAVNLASAIAIPATGLFTIFAPQVSALVKQNDMATLKVKYVETAKLLFFIGAVLVGAVVVGVDALFQLLPSGEKLMASVPVIYVLAANILFNMGTGFNSEIISYSKYYKFNIVSVLCLVLVNIMLNLYFLTQTSLGIVGVAYASLIAMTLFNLIKLLFINKKFGILPFNKEYVLLIVVMSVIFVGVLLLPSIADLWIELIVKVGLVILLSLSVVYKLKLVYTLNQWVDKLLKK